MKLGCFKYVGGLARKEVSGEAWALAIVSSPHALVCADKKHHFQKNLACGDGQKVLR